MLAILAARRLADAPLKLLAGALLALTFYVASAPGAGAQIRDPQNTIIFTVGLGYSSPADNSPSRTAQVAVELVPKYAPKHAARMKELAREGFYNGKLFHRVIEGFMAQTGSPRGDGIGGAPGKKDLKSEFSDIKFERGVVGMARSASYDSANSQFFIMFERNPSLDRNYTVVGRVISGMDAILELKRTHRYTRKGEDPIPGLAPDRIISAKVASD